MAWHYYQKREFIQADKYFRLAVSQVDKAPQLKTKLLSLIGRYYEEGQGFKQDYSEALKWYRLLANRGKKNAQIKLGIFYKDGLGVDRNYSEAKKWFEFASSYAKIGDIYMKEQNWRKAIISYLKVQYDVLVQYNLGVCYANVGNMQEAYKWYSKAADSGLLKAQNALERLKQQ